MALQFLVDLLSGALVLVDVPGSSLPSTGLLSEAGEYLLFENGDYIIQE